IQPIDGAYNLPNYKEVYQQFSWNDVEKEFSWHQTGKVNMAYECIDRHVVEGYGDKIALHYVNGDEEQVFTFKEIQEKTDHLAAVLKKYGVKKGDIVF